MKMIKWLSNKLGVQSDKVLHFLVSFVIAFPLMAVNIYLAIGVTLAIGLYKEFTDSHKEDNYWSWGDILADIIGMIGGLLLWAVSTFLY